MSDLNDLFSKLLSETRGGEAGPKPKKPRYQTYAQSYSWQLDSFVLPYYETICDACGTIERSVGQIMKKSVDKRSANVVTMTKIAGLHELSSHPNLPRIAELKRSASLVCAQCCGELFNFKVKDHAPTQKC